MDTQAGPTAAKLLQDLDMLEKDIPALGCRVLPSSFTAEDPLLRAFPRSSNWKWKSLEHTFKAFGTHMMMIHLPLFWQVESYIHAACEGTSAIFVNEPYNIPVSGAAITLTEIDTVLARPEDAAALYSYIREKNIRTPQHWILIHNAEDPDWNLPKLFNTQAESVIQEVHLMPGVPLLWQCIHLKNQSAHFHISDEFVWNISDTKTLITSQNSEPYLFSNFEIPFTLTQHKSTCVCGNVVVKRLDKQLL